MFTTVPGFHNCYRVEAFPGVQTKTGLLGGCSVLHHHDELRVSIVAWHSYGSVCFPSTVILIIKLVQLRVDFKLICKNESELQLTTELFVSSSVQPLSPFVASVMNRQDEANLRFSERN